MMLELAEYARANGYIVASPTVVSTDMLDRILEKAESAHKGVLILVDEVQSNSEELKKLIIAYQEAAGEGKNRAHPATHKLMKKR